MPLLSRHEKVLLRQTERKNLLEERFGIEVESPKREAQEVIEDEAGSASSHALGGSRASSRISSQAGAGRKSSSTSIPIVTSGRSAQGKRLRRGVPRDTHMFEAEAQFKGITVPIRIPMTVLADDVGDVS